MTLAHGVFGMYLLVICLGAGFAVFSPTWCAPWSA